MTLYRLPTHFVACAALLVTACVLALPASAGLIPSSVNINFAPPGPPSWAGTEGPPPFVFEIVPDEAELPGINIDENLGGEDLDLQIAGGSAGGTTITINKNVTNNSSVAWVGYDIGVDTGVTFVNGSASSDKFTVIDESPNLLSFGQPSAVQPGDSVMFNFQILIPEDGDFSFDLSQRPQRIPEPTSIAIVALGAVAFGCHLRRRRRVC